MFLDPKLMFLNEILLNCPGEFQALSREPKTCAHMKFFDWNMCIRFLGVKKRRVALYTHWAFSIMVEISKWRILIYFEILMSPNIGILYIVGKSFSCWTTFLLTKKSENVLNVSKRRQKVSKWRHHFPKIWHLLQINKKDFSCRLTFLLTKRSKNVLSNV